MAGNYLSFNRLLSHLRRTEEQIDASSRPLSDDVRRDSTDGKTRSHQDHEGESRSTLWAQVVATVLQEDKVPQCVIQRINWKHGVAERERKLQRRGLSRLHQTHGSPYWPELLQPPVDFVKSFTGQKQHTDNREKMFDESWMKSFNLKTNVDWKLSHWTLFFFIQCERVVINTSKKLIL